jgi:hypothetical protein
LARVNTPLLPTSRKYPREKLRCQILAKRNLFPVSHSQTSLSFTSTQTAVPHAPLLASSPTSTRGPLHTRSDSAPHVHMDTDDDEIMARAKRLCAELHGPSPASTFITTTAQSHEKPTHPHPATTITIESRNPRASHTRRTPAPDCLYLTPDRAPAIPWAQDQRRRTPRRWEARSSGERRSAPPPTPDEDEDAATPPVSSSSFFSSGFFFNGWFACPCAVLPQDFPLPTRWLQRCTRADRSRTGAPSSDTPRGS